MKAIIAYGFVFIAIHYIGYVDGDPVEKCPSTNGNALIPDDTDCHLFYQCSWGVAYRMECSGSLLFDYNLQVCNYPAQTVCYSGGSIPVSSEKTTSSEKPSTTQKPISSESPGSGGETNDSGESWNEACTSDIVQYYFPDPKDCKAFYICNAGVLHHIICPDDKVYNPAYRICDFSRGVTCSETPGVVDPEPIDPGSDGEDGGEDGSGNGNGNGNGGNDSGESWQSSCTIGSIQIYYPDPEDCQGFYMCEFGTLKHMSCPLGTLYNAALLICDYPGNVRCSQEPEVVNPEPVYPGDGGNPGEDGGDSGEDGGNTGGNGGGESWSEACSKDSKQMYFPDSENCQGFYICEFGVLQHMMCPPGTLYNAPILTCDFPGNVRCSESPIGVDPEQVN